MSLIDTVLASVRAFLGEPLAKSLHRRLRAAAPSPISELREGLHCRIAGTVRVLDNATLVAPFTKQACVAYQLEVVATAPSGDEHLLIYDKKAVPFVVADDEHNALVDPEHAQLLVSTMEEVWTRAGSRDPRQRALFERYETVPDERAMRRIHYREWVILPGRRVSIAGTGSREVDPHAIVERGYRDAARQRLRFIGSAQLPLLIGDDPP